MSHIATNAPPADIRRSKRKRFLDLLARRAPKYRRSAPSAQRLDDIFEHRNMLTTALNLSGLSGIPFAIVGGHAINLHGINRMTQDVDLMVAPIHWDAARAALGGGVASAMESPRPARPIRGVSFTGHDSIYDLIWVDEWSAGALEHAIQTTKGPALSGPYLVLSKLWAGRGEQDDTDVIGILRALDAEQLTETTRLVARHVPDDRDDLEQMIEISRL